MDTILKFLSDNETLVYLLVFMAILGFVIISNVPTILHTPLMSGSNAVSGIVIIGGILLLRSSESSDYISLFFGMLAVILGMINVIGGFVVTNRMLAMFKKDKRT